MEWATDATILPGGNRRSDHRRRPPVSVAGSRFNPVAVPLRPPAASSPRHPSPTPSNVRPFAVNVIAVTVNVIDHLLYAFDVPINAPPTAMQFK